MVTVFVVDDYPGVASSVRRALRGGDFRVVDFQSPLHALQAACSTKPDVLVTDAVMPDLSGVELSAALRVMYPAMGTVLMSSLATLEALADDAIVAVLGKPWEAANLLTAVRAAARWSDARRRAGKEA